MATHSEPSELPCNTFVFGMVDWKPSNVPLTHFSFSPLWMMNYCSARCVGDLRLLGVCVEPQARQPQGRLHEAWRRGGRKQRLH